MLINNDLIFIHVPKSAGSSVTNIIGHIDGTTELTDQPLYLHALTFSPHVPALQMKAVLANKEWEARWKFAVVRNPWDRMTSIYRYVNRPFKLDKWFGEEWEKVQAKITTFTDFVYNYDMTGLGVWWFDHRTPQIRWAEGVDSIFKAEEMNVLEKELESRGYPLKIPQHNVSLLPQDHEPNFYRTYYNDETRALVAEWFAEDIELFGYEF